MLNLENETLIFESYLKTNRKKKANDNIKIRLQLVWSVLRPIKSI